MSHYRRITKSEFRELQARLSETVEVDGEEQTFTPGEYDTFACFHAVVVGKDGSGAYLVHVNRDDSDGLPGTHVGDSIAELTGAARGAVARARIRRTVARGDIESGLTKTEAAQDVEIEELVPEGAIPEGAEVLETGLAPHAFAGV